MKRLVLAGVRITLLLAMWVAASAQEKAVPTAKNANPEREFLSQVTQQSIECHDRSSGGSGGRSVFGRIEMFSGALK